VVPAGRYLCTAFDVSSVSAGGMIVYQSKAQTLSCSPGICARSTTLKSRGGLSVRVSRTIEVSGTYSIGTKRPPV
jgi:hypothetical protein